MIIKKKTEILAILNKYKNIFDDFINNLDKKSQDPFEPIDKGIIKVLKFESGSKSFLKKK